ncbi:hypothetical protein LTR95_011523 [Oleoguttula sp. CCFEE 5521]|uniref:Calcofluor white hypersensitive protein n=1 Tax=Cryoendolithus antarcticus TaxID=1507870 RepID=A0A1V8SYV3_9PEZI|nr:hypothetical protein B0A48_10967 [Cryoendolithus antarcticus]
MSNRAIPAVGVAVAAAAGYYLYQSGGDPKAAEKRLEADAAKLRSKASTTNTSEVQNKGSELQKNASVLASDARAEVERLANQAKSKGSEVDAKLEAYRADAAKKLEGAYAETSSKVNEAADKFDRNVQQGAKEAKGTLSSWFGGK